MSSADLNDQKFAHNFEFGALPPGTFTHEGHLRLAYVYLCDHDLNAAHSKLKSELQGFLQRNNVDPKKYHETMTRAWMMAVDAFMHRIGDTANFEEFKTKAAPLFSTQAMLTHYSKDRLLSEQARVEFIEPDLQSIPPPHWATPGT